MFFKADRYENSVRPNKKDELVAALAAYENIELTPQEIYELKAGTILKVIGNQWIPVEERLPEGNDYVLMSFENFSLPLVGRYECDGDGSGAWYLGDCDEEDTCVSNDLFVNAWMPLLEPYKTDSEENKWDGTNEENKDSAR